MARFIKVTEVKKYVKAKKRRCSRELINHLDARIQIIIDDLASRNSLTTLRP